LNEIRVAYIRRLREQAAGRAAVGDLDLAGERAALAKAQRERIEMQNAVTRGELAPVVLQELLEQPDFSPLLY
jgi:phage terminase Nu1 subunit (DNA packaging protein)